MRKGFSLVEVLLALAIGGLVLMAASSLLVTISQAWANRPATRDRLAPSAAQGLDGLGPW